MERRGATFATMRMGNMERRQGANETGACAVCGAADARTLSFTRLEDGTRVVVCGSHKMAHRRATKLATSVAELVTMLRDRRSA